MNAKITDAVRTPMEMVHMFKETNPEMGQQIMEEISKLNPSLVLNQTRTQTDTVIGYSMQKVCKKYFGINLNYSGYLDYDAAVWQSVRSKKPLLMEFPNSKLVYNFEMIVNQLLRS
jgi:flagellar biosynthesis protein FlhG